MKLEEKHKEFAVKCYARFLTRTEVVNAFIEEFADDLPPPPEYPEFSQEAYEQEYEEEYRADDEGPDAILDRDEFVACQFETYKSRYEQVYGADATEKFEADREKLQEEIIQQWYIEDTVEGKRERYYNLCKLKVKAHYQQVKRDISSQLRRLNIVHRQFPEKYRALFNQAREQYFNDYRGENLGISENVLKELEILLGYVKQCIFNEENEREAMQFMTLGHQILKTVVAHNAVSGKQEVVDITPQSVKALTDSQKALTSQPGNSRR